MKRFWLFWILLAIGGLLAGCSEDDEPSKPKSTATLPPPTVQISAMAAGDPAFAANIIQGFEATNPIYNIDMLGGAEVNQGIQALASDAAQVIGMTHLPTEEELALIPDLKYVEVGQLGIGIFTRQDTGVTALTADQAAAIFSGEITNWSEVGGPDQPIRVFVRIEGVLPTQMMQEYLMGDTPFAASATIMQTAPLMSDSIASTPYSIGYEVWPAVLLRDLEVTPITLDGYGPTDPGYLMLSSAGMGYRAKNEDTLQPFIDRLNSTMGKRRLAQFGIIFSEQEGE